MRVSVLRLRTHAYTMRGMRVPANSLPASPLLQVVIRGGSQNVLIWRGATLAASYTIERSTSGANGTWMVICNKCATDTSTPWTDTTAPAGAAWYKVTAYNVSGMAGMSSIPYQASSGSMIVDNLNDWSKTYEHSGNLTFDTTNSEYMHSDSSRVVRKTSTNEEIIWRQTNIISFQAIGYFWPSEPISHFSIYLSADGRNWSLSEPTISSIHGNWLEYIYTLNNLLNVNYVMMMWNNTNGQTWNPELGEVTIAF